ncbi:putative SCP extracellular domain containing protein, partial [Neospora caninum Liverpool]
GGGLLSSAGNAALPGWRFSGNRLGAIRDRGIDATPAPRPSPDRWDCGTHEATACGVVSPLAPLRDVAVPSGGRREVRRHVDSFALSGFALAAPILADEPETTGLATPSTSELPGEAVSVPQAAAGALSRVVRDAEGDRGGHGQNQRATETGGDHRLSPQAERVSPSPLHVEPQSNLLDFSSMPSSHEPAFTPQTEMRLRNRPMRKYLRRRLRHLPPPTHLISGAGQPSASAEHWVDVEDVTDKCLRYINWYRQEGLEHPLEPIKATTTLREDAAALVRRLTLTHCRGAYPFPSPRPLVPGAFDANWFGAKEPDCSFAALTWFSQFRHFDGQFPGAPVEELASGFRVGEFARMMHRRATGIGCARTRSCAGGVNWLVCLYGSVPHRPNNADLRAEDVIFGPEVWESILQREASAPGGTQAKEVLSASSEEADVSLHIRLSGTSEDALREGGGAIERPASASESSFSEAGRQFATQSSSMVGETFEGHDELWRVSWPGRMDLRPRGISGLAPRPRLAEVWGQDISEESVMDIARGGRRGVTIDEKGGIDKLFMTLTGRDGQDELLVVEVDEHSAERENEAELDIASSNQFQTAEQSDADEP